MRVVVAPDKFKGSLTAAEVVDAVASGLPANAATLLHEMGRRIARDWLLDPS